ncbi:hypothetical protein AZI86_17275 [Bdellovibrio bacteriovorus]|uniref:Response regulatory domain-containing protein n=1 Tax=Bdellovibrio bacteriovorus TaxID=959 RepID=A0A150WET7_BDEBC|nr:response regulator [Bdellovibrio bacteriovorus]KYG61464.1 hypothetical protein AZI86_17275 [Bdellovibrio bacteriovorus]
MREKKTIRLLHIDDSATLRKTIERGLEPYKSEYALTQANSAEEALQLLASGSKFDVVLTDWMMTGKSGFDLLCILKSHPAYHDIPVFFLTTESDGPNFTMAMAFGSAGLLKKPITVPEIYAFLQKKMHVIEESFVISKNDIFVTKTQALLQDFKRLLPSRSTTDLENCLKGTQILKAMSSSSRWPVLGYYATKMEAAIQETLKMGHYQNPPLNTMLSEFVNFMEKAAADIQAGTGHAIFGADLERQFKTYHENLKAGWFNAAIPTPSQDGLWLSWDAVNQLQKHLDNEGKALLQSHIASKKSAA